ncbi:MAG: hypothetical protein N2Z72_04455 [Bacteroidales bacterium]|nr:hypothetical protein [Bacteroidales bacterium]
MRNFLSLFFLMFSVSNVFAQNETKTSVKFSGFVKTDIIYDTRQSSPANALREGHFYLFPDSILRDSDGKDINDNDVFHILSIQTRVRASLTGPDVLNAKTSGLIETEFFGTGEGDMNGLRLRHAFLKLNWPKTELMIGQFWHPMFPVNAIPGTISFNTGAPFIPFSRNPQVKLSYRFIPSFSVNFTAWSERDFTSTGPAGPSSRYLRNSAIPGLNGEFVIKLDSIQFLFVAGANYFEIIPELKTDSNYYSNSKVSALSFYGYLQQKIKNFTSKIGANYAQNAHNIMMIGGYAACDILDTVKNIKKYTSFVTGTIWADFQLNLAKWQLGMYCAYAKNMGTLCDLKTGSKTYVRGQNIDYLYRISPRISYVVDKVMFSSEVEITNAAYGKLQNNGKVTKTHDVSNIRLLLAVFYNF